MILYCSIRRHVGPKKTAQWAFFQRSLVASSSFPGYRSPIRTSDLQAKIIENDLAKVTGEDQQPIEKFGHDLDHF